jgi:hypothetical protein
LKRRRAYSQTLLRSSRASGVLQHPAAVFDLHEAGPIVLTNTHGASALARFPPAADTHFLIYALGSRTVIGELWGNPERDVVFALPAGRYLAQRTSAVGSAGLEFSLAPSETRTLRADEFRSVPEEQLATKGGAVVLWPNEIGVEASVGASRLSSFGELLGLRYAHQWDDWAVSIGVTGGRGTQNTSAENATLASLGCDVGLQRRWTIGSVGLGFGLGAEADVIWQTLDRADSARVAAAGYPTIQRYVGLAPGPIALAHIREPIGLRTWVELAARGGVLLPELSGGLGEMWTWRAEAGVGVQF